MLHFYEKLLQELDKLRALPKAWASQETCFQKPEESTLWKCYDFLYSLILGYA